MASRAPLFLLLAGLAALGHAQSLTLPPLPYAYDALEPIIDEATMRVHHLGHHAAYTDKTNAVLAALRSNASTHHLAKLGIDALLRQLHRVPSPQRTTLQNHGGGFVNHDLFWRSMAPPHAAGGGGAGGRFDEGSQLAAAITGSFGSLDFFKTAFSTAASGVFGSGWVWLEVSSPHGALAITTTPNQDSPMMEGRVAILCLDVWEHAYYLKHQNKRADYIRDWWGVVNWEGAAALFDRAVEEAAREEGEEGEL